MSIVSDESVYKHRYDRLKDVYDDFGACDHIEYFEEASSALHSQIDVAAARHYGFGYCSMASVNVERSLILCKGDTRESSTSIGKKKSSSEWKDSGLLF